MSRSQIVLLVGDGLALAAVTLAGFATHNTLGSAGARMLTTFVPLLIAWAGMGILLGVFQPDRAEAPGQLWRPFLAMVLAAPWFGLIRAWMLGVDAISALFLVILGGIAALAIAAWRAVFVFILAFRLK